MTTRNIYCHACGSPLTAALYCNDCGASARSDSFAGMPVPLARTTLRPVRSRIVAAVVSAAVTLGRRRRRSRARVAA